MESGLIRNSKKSFLDEGSSSSYTEPNIVAIHEAISESKFSEQNSVGGHEVILVDEEQHDNVVIVDEKDSSPVINTIVGHEVVAVDEDDAVVFDEKDAFNDKGKKLLVNKFAGQEVDTPDGVIPSPQASEIVEEAMAPKLSASASASAASEKHAVPESSCFKEDHPKAVKSKSFFKSLFSKRCFMPKFACFGSKLRSFNRRASASHVEMHASPSTFAAVQSPPIAEAGDVHFHLDQGLKLDDFHPNSAEFPPPSSDGQSNSSQDSILKNLELFKNFDISEDHFGHSFEVINECSNPSNEWVKYIADEWKMLESGLPDAIYVRVYEARMDLLRAVIIGANGTPYHDGLFFFDIQFPSSYPKVPPAVKYYSHGLKINPILRPSGDVCLSLLLGTSDVVENEYWRPYQSNMLQVLVSIQGLVLNAEPFSDDPDVPSNQTSHKTRSENTYIDSLKTILYTLRSPPKGFEDLVQGHFYMHAHDILAACSAYLDGVEVGSYVKGNPQATASENIENCSEYLNMMLPHYINLLVKAFTKIGVKDCEKYSIPEELF